MTKARIEYRDRQVLLFKIQQKSHHFRWKAPYANLPNSASSPAVWCICISGGAFDFLAAKAPTRARCNQPLSFTRKRANVVIDGPRAHLTLPRINEAVFENKQTGGAYVSLPQISS
jgi:hypothetical protein